MASFGENRNFKNIKIENIGKQETKTQPIPTEEMEEGGRIPNSDIFKVHLGKLLKVIINFTYTCNNSLVY